MSEGGRDEQSAGGSTEQQQQQQQSGSAEQDASTRSAAHVVLRSVIEFDEGDAQIRFDAATRHLVLIKHHTFEALPLNRALPPIVVESKGKVENVRFSLNHRFAAVQRSDHELEFMDLLTGNAFSHSCKGGGSKGRWRILSFHWTGTPIADFVVATSAGVEFYLVLPEKGTLKLVKHMAHAVAWAVYSHVTRMIILATGPQDNVMHGIQIQPQSLVRIPKFEVVLAPPSDASSPTAASAYARATGHAKNRRSLLPGHLTVARLYDMIFCVHVEPERQQVHLYQLFKDFVVRKYCLAIYSRQAAVSVSDNLLIVHAIDSRVCLIFDLRINAQFPITAPLPIATVATEAFSPLYSPHWSLASPDYVIDPQAGRVGQLRLDLGMIARSSIDKACLLQFLLSRSLSSGVILEVFAKALREEEGLPVLGKMFDLLHAAIARSLLSRRSLGGLGFGGGGGGGGGAAPPVATSPSPVASPCATASPAAASNGRGVGTPAPAAPHAAGSGSVAASLSAMDVAAPAVAPMALAVGGAEGGGEEAALSGAVAGMSVTSGDGEPSASTPSASASAPDTPAAPSEIPPTVLPTPDRAATPPPQSDVFVRAVFESASAALPTAVDARCPRRRYLIGALSEFLRSQQEHGLPLDIGAGTLLFSLLEAQGSYYQLHQLVQYHLVPDAMDLAYRLLSLESRYPPCADLAMDMFRRLGPLGNDALMSCLLERGRLLAACRFIRAQRLLNYPPRPLLAAAAAHRERASLFPAVFHFFSQRNEVWRGSPAFLPDEGCDEFVALWEASYVEDAARGGPPPAASPLGAAGEAEAPSHRPVIDHGGAIRRGDGEGGAAGGGPATDGRLASSSPSPSSPEKALPGPAHGSSSPLHSPTPATPPPPSSAAPTTTQEPTGAVRVD